MWGGSRPGAFDCSGFTQYVFKKRGKHLPRLAHWQSNVGNFTSLKDAKPGDLIFFGKRKSLNWYATHVGIVVENKNGIVSFIHAARSKGVTLTTLQKSRYWTKRYLFVKSGLPRQVDKMIKTARGYRVPSA